MFDIGWSELVVIGIVALIVVGPKELPTLLKTVGKYVGLIKRQAAEFRAQFDEAMRETELDQLKKDVENIKSQAEGTLRDVERSVETEVTDFKRELDETARGATGGDPSAMHDANGLPFPIEGGAIADTPPPAPATSAGAAAIAAAAAAAPPVTPAQPTAEAKSSPTTSVGA